MASEKNKLRIKIVINVVPKKRAEVNIEHIHQNGLAV